MSIEIASRLVIFLCMVVIAVMNHRIYSGILRENERALAESLAKIGKGE